MKQANTLRTLARFLIGRRDAIEQIAASPAATLASLVFVLSAGFAREYDGEYLFGAPWHFLRPIGASLASGTILFIIVHPCIRALLKPADHTVSFATAYRRFMTCYWMTAPLAWLYAIPYERFLSPADAVRVNLITLGIVAAWRVLLISHVTSVLYKISLAPAFFFVMLFADTVLWLVATYIPAPVIGFMGGVQHTERDAILANFTFNLQIISFLTAPIWIIGALIAAGLSKRRAAELDATPIPARNWAAIAAASLLIWIPPLLITQPEQARRHAVVHRFDSGDIPGALAELSKHPESAYPPRWELPPRLGYREESPDLNAIRIAIQAQPQAEWVTAKYFDKINSHAKRQISYYGSSWASIRAHVSRLSPDDAARMLGRPKLGQPYLEQMRFLLEHADRLDPLEVAALEALTDRLETALTTPPPQPEP